MTGFEPATPPPPADKRWLCIVISIYLLFVLCW